MATEYHEVAVFETKDRVLSFNVPAGPFTTVTVDGLYSDPRGLHLDSVVRHQWTPEEIEAYHGRVERHELFAVPVKHLAARFGRDVLGGLAGRALSILDAPVHRPQNRSLLVQNCQISTAGVAFRQGMDDSR